MTEFGRDTNPVSFLVDTELRCWPTGSRTDGLVELSLDILEYFHSTLSSFLLHSVSDLPCLSALPASSRSPSVSCHRGSLPKKIFTCLIQVWRVLHEAPRQAHLPNLSPFCPNKIAQRSCLPICPFSPATPLLDLRHQACTLSTPTTSLAQSPMTSMC